MAESVTLKYLPSSKTMKYCKSNHNPYFATTESKKPNKVNKQLADMHEDSLYGTI